MEVDPAKVFSLLQSAGHEVTISRDGNEAVDLITDQTFDLMISDFRMRPVDGLGLLSLAKELRPAMPVPLCTGSCSASVTVE